MYLRCFTSLTKFFIIKVQKNRKISLKAVLIAKQVIIWDNYNL